MKTGNFLQLILLEFVDDDYILERYGKFDLCYTFINIPYFKNCFNWNIFRSDLERAFKHTNSTLSEMTQSNWIIDYGENSKERILLNLR